MMSGRRGMGMIGSALLCVAVPVALFGSAALADSGIAGSPHNLSGRAAAEAIEICVFCHIPKHTGAPNPPLWSQSDETPGNFIAYADPVGAESVVAKPYGISLVCLSCHDATIAMDVAAAAFAPFDGDPLGPGGFTDIHPISTSYYQGYDPAFKTPKRGKVGELPLFRASGARDEGNRVECPSCHNPHEIVFGKFLRVSNSDSALCRNCHNK